MSESASWLHGDGLRFMVLILRRADSFRAIPRPLRLADSPAAKYLLAMAQLGPGPYKTEDIAAALSVRAAAVAAVRKSISSSTPVSRPVLSKIEQYTQRSYVLIRGNGAQIYLNLHAQMAHSPAVLAAYTSLRAVIAEYGALEPKVSWALNLATAVTVGNDYMIAIASQFARMNGWTDAQIAALRTGTTTGDTKIDALTRVVREAAATSGNVTDVTWSAAQQGGWSDTQLAEAFAHLGLTVFTGYFLNYAQTDPYV